MEKETKIKKNYLKFVLSGFLLMLCIFGLSNCFPAQKDGNTKNSDELLFKFLRGSFENVKKREIILHIYKSGRIDCESFRQEFEEKFHNRKADCSQINQEKIKELTNLAKQADFLAAAEIYKIFDKGYDYGYWAEITYFSKPVNKTVKFDTFDRYQNEKKESLPETVGQLFEKMKEIEKSSDQNHF